MSAELTEGAALSPGWSAFLAREREKDYYLRSLTPFLEREYAEQTVYPAREKIFRALELTPLEAVKVCILGQDPYHEPGQAQGLAFSVPEGVALPPSLKNIFAEIDAEYGCGAPESGDLTRWARQGVLLLNTVLTVRAHEANSHAGHGWEKLTDGLLRELALQARPLVFLLWGGPAAKKARLISSPEHLVLRCAHPSPLSVYRGFRGCGHFRACNAFLEEKGLAPIDWAGAGTKGHSEGR